jgi:hypothetical protein
MCVTARRCDDVVKSADRAAACGREQKWKQPVDDTREPAADHLQPKARRETQVLEVSFADVVGVIREGVGHACLQFDP